MDKVSPSISLSKTSYILISFLNMAKLFAPGSEYTIDGYTHDEVVAIVTSGRWKELGWDLRY